MFRRRKPQNLTTPYFTPKYVDADAIRQLTMRYPARKERYIHSTIRAIVYRGIVFRADPGYRDPVTGEERGMEYFFKTGFQQKPTKHYLQMANVGTNTANASVDMAAANRQLMSTLRGGALGVTLDFGISTSYSYEVVSKGLWQNCHKRYCAEDIYIIDLFEGNMISIDIDACAEQGINEQFQQMSKRGIGEVNVINSIPGPLIVGHYAQSNKCFTLNGYYAGDAGITV